MKIVKLEVRTANKMVEDGYALTLNKEYTILKNQGEYVYVVNDIDKINSYPSKWFSEVNPNQSIEDLK